MAIFRRGSTPTTGVSNAGGVGKNRDLSQYLAPSRAVNGSTTKCNILSCERRLNKRLRSKYPTVEAITTTDTKHRAASLQQQTYLYLAMT